MNVSTSSSDFKPNAYQVSRIKKSISGEVNDIVRGAEKIVIIDFLVGFLFIFRGVSIFSQPLGTLALTLYVLYRCCTKPKKTIKYSGFLGFIFLILFSYMTFVSYIYGESSNFQILQRILRMAIIVLLAIFIGEQRIDFRSLIFGFCSALIFNALGFYAGIAPADYGKYLTGWIEDKNVAGLYYAIAPLLLITIIKKKWQIILVFLFSLPLLWLTGSRTSIGGFILGVLWLFFAGKLNLFFKFFLGGLVMWLFEWAQNTFADSEVFGDRTGTDWFREQIDKSSWIKVQSTPWYGRGLGQAFAPVESHENQFFHNSYWTLFVEGGWPWLIGILGITLLSVYFWRQPKKQRKIGAESSMILLLVCSWRLGEVILTMPWALTIGLALLYLSEERKRGESNLLWNEQKKNSLS